MNCSPIHFIIRKINRPFVNQQGFSYIEVLVAAAILAVIMIPVVGGLYATAQNHETARRIYHATLMAENILAEVRTSPSELTDISPQGALDGFDYAVTLTSLTTGESRFYTSNPTYTEESGVVTNYQQPPLPFDDLGLIASPHVLSGGGLLIQELPPITPSTAFSVTVSIFDKQGKLLKRLGSLC